MDIPAAQRKAGQASTQVDYTSNLDIYSKANRYSIRFSFSLFLLLVIFRSFVLSLVLSFSFSLLLFFS